MQRASEFLDNLQRTDGADATIAVLTQTLARFGLEYFTFQDFPNPDQYDKFVFCRNVPDEWVKLYTERKYNRIDPAFRKCRQATEPFIWADAPFDAQREPEVAEFVRRVADFALDKGVMIPVPHINAPSGVVWFGGQNADLNGQTLPCLHLIALYAFERLRKFHTPPYAAMPLLTPRERDVLALAAAGHTAWEIGEHLNIAKRTADCHIDAVMRKLGTANRTHAVAIALRDGLIGL